MKKKHSNETPRKKSVLWKPRNTDKAHFVFRASDESSAAAEPRAQRKRHTRGPRELAAAIYKKREEEMAGVAG